MFFKGVVSGLTKSFPVQRKSLDDRFDVRPTNNEESSKFNHLQMRFLDIFQCLDDSCYPLSPVVAVERAFGRMPKELETWTDLDWSLLDNKRPVQVSCMYPA